MSIQLPYPLPADSGWVLIGYSPANLKSAPAAGGAGCLIEFGPVPDTEVWEIDRMSVSCSVAAAGSCLLYEDAIANARIIDGTGDGHFDVNDCHSPIRLLGGTTMLIVWPDAPDGAIGSSRLQYRRLARRGG